MRNLGHCTLTVTDSGLDLAACDTNKRSKVVKDALDITHEVSKLLKYSPRRDSIFEKIKAEVSPDTAGFRVLCPTRSTVRGATLASVIENYSKDTLIHMNLK